MSSTVPTADTAIFDRRESVVRSYCRGIGAVFESAKGSEMTDKDGKKYIDFLAGCSSLNYGHNDPDMTSALVEHIQAGGLAHGLDYYSTTKADFLNAFEKIILEPRGMPHRVMFTGPTGANAVEAAMKLARKVTGRTNIVTFTNGYHGVTMGALAATGASGHRGNGAGLQGVSRVPFDKYMGDEIDSVALLEKMLADGSSGIDAPAAIMLETVQGEGGLNAASPEFVRRVGELAKKHGALFIIDDIQAGCGRTGTFFSFEEMGVEPDLITMAKSLSGFGLPFAAVLIRPEHDIWNPAEHNGTFRGNTHAFLTAKVALEKFWADGSFQKEVAEKSETLKTRLTEISQKVPGSRLKGRGMMQGVDVGSGELAEKICARCFDKGLIIETSGPDDEVVKVLAPLTTPHETLEAGLAIVAESVDEIVSTEKLAAE